MSSTTQTVLIASDHAGFELKTALISLLSDVVFEDLGPLKQSRVDYPDYAAKLAEAVSKAPDTRGILICGSGIGMCIAANKFKNIRAALVNEPVSARLAREHNDTNIICLGARFLAPQYAAEITRVWLSTPFSKDPRHEKRIAKITQIEKRDL